MFVGYQNGVGPNGEPSPTGNKKSTVVEYTLQGKVVGSWSLVGKVDGLGADPERHRVIATRTRTATAASTTIKPLGDGKAEIKHYTFNQNPLPHGGGTDSVIVRDGVIYLSASNPSADANGTTFSGPALYTADLDGGTAVLKAVLKDDSTAVDAVTGKQVTLNLSDPDSSEVVPHAVPRFGGDVLLDSQGDGELIFLHHPDSRHQTATVLHISTQVDDSAFATGPCETLLVVDNSLDEILAVTGPFQPGEAFEAVPNDSTVIPGNLGTLDLSTGKVTAFGSGFGNPHGLLFVEWPSSTGGRARLRAASGLDGHVRDRVPDEPDQHGLDRIPVAGVAGQHRDVRGDREGLADVLDVVRLQAVEGVDADDVGQPRVVEVVDRREAVGQPAGVDEHHRAYRAAAEVVPHEPEAVLAGGAEQVQDQILGEADPAEVHRDGRGHLVRDRAQVVDAVAGGGHDRLGGQRVDLGDRADERGLADAEAAGHHDLRRGDPHLRGSRVH